MSKVHELMLLGIVEDIDADGQLLVMEALDQHLARCEGHIARHFFRTEDGRWVKRVVRVGRADLETSARLEDEPVVAELFERFDERSASYLRGVRVESEGLPPADRLAPL